VFVVLDLLFVTMVALRTVALYQRTSAHRAVGEDRWHAFEAAVADTLSASELRLLRLARGQWLARQARSSRASDTGAVLSIERCSAWQRWLERRLPALSWDESRPVAWGSEWRQLGITTAVLALCADLPGGEIAAIAVKAPVGLNALIVAGDVLFAIWCWHWVQYSRHNPHLIASAAVRISMEGWRWMHVPADSIAGRIHRQVRPAPGPRRQEW